MTRSTGRDTYCLGSLLGRRTVIQQEQQLRAAADCLDRFACQKRL
jgi:hypothetical protein